MERAFGPYTARNKWRIVVAVGVGATASRRTLVFESRAEAQAAVDAIRAQANVKTVEAVMEDFLVYRRSAGTKGRTLVTHEYRLRGLLGPALGTAVHKLRPERAQELYTAYCEGRAPDTHHGSLSVAKAMFEFARKRKLVGANPWTDIEPVGRKRRRKAQLRIDEARKLTAWLVAHAATDDRALGVLIALVLGLRAHEVVGIVARDLDDGGRVLHVAKSKTHAGERPVVLPEIVGGPLRSRAALRQRLLPYQPGWVRDAARWACALAGVPRMSAQALRGANATLALEAGAAPEVVARSLGHTSPTMTRAAYALPGSGRSIAVQQIQDRLLYTTASEPEISPKYLCEEGDSNPHRVTH